MSDNTVSTRLFNEIPLGGSAQTASSSAMKNDSMMGQAITTMEDIMALFTELANAKFGQMSRKTEISRDAQDRANQVEAILAKLVKPDSKAALPQDVVAYMRANNIPVNDKTIDEFIATQADGASHMQLLRALIAGAGPDGMPSASWQSVVSYMDAQGITVQGQKASDYIWALQEVGMQPNKKISFAHMQEILGALEGAAQFDKGDLMAVKAALESVSGRASDFVQQNQLKLQQIMQNFNTAVSMANSVQSMNAESTKAIAQAIR